MVEIFSEKEYRFEPPPQLNIYRLRRPDTSETGVRRAGSRFGLRTSVEAGTFVQNAQGVAYSEASAWGLKLFRQSGGFQYRNEARWQVDDGKGRLHIEDEQATRLAIDALRQYALPVEPELELLRVQRLHVAHAQRRGENHEERIVGARVLFRRMLDGVPTEGPGGKTTVYLDHERELTGIDHLSRDIESVHTPVERLRPVEEAFEEVRRRYGSGPGRIEVTEVRFGYFELGWDQEQEYLQPAYVVYVRLGSPDSRFRMNAIVPVAAAVNAVGPIEPFVRTRQAQDPRNG